MTTLLIACLLLGAGGATAAVYRAIRAKVATRRSLERKDATLIAQLARDGVSVRGDLDGAFELEGIFYGVRILLQNRMEEGAGQDATKSLACGTIIVPAPVQNMLLCKTCDVAGTGGDRLRMVPLTIMDADLRTNYSAFGPAINASEGTFRTPPSSEPWAWISPMLIRQLMVLDLRSIQVRNEQCAILTGPIGRSTIYSALALGANVARASSGKSLVPPDAIPEEPFSAAAEQRRRLPISARSKRRSG